MRVIAGKARRLNHKTVPGMDTRPTTDRIKETLFNILQPELLDCHFLDLFSGSGAIGIEALSRGAARAVFVEKNPKACTCIRENLTFTKTFADSGTADVMQALGLGVSTAYLWIPHITMAGASGSGIPSGQQYSG